MQDSISNSHNWQTVDEIVIPSGRQESLVPYGMPQPSTSQPAMVYRPWQPVIDSVAKAREDSLIRSVNDSLAHIPNPYGIVIDAPYSAPAEYKLTSHNNYGSGLSWIFLVLGVLFCAVCLKLKNTPGYLMTLWADFREVRFRHNVFDNTVKETSFLILLLIGWMCCAGILLWELVRFLGGMPFMSRHLFPDAQLEGCALCSAVAGVYVIFMLLNYELVGNVFSDARITRLWVKGATAGFGLQTMILFPVALLALCYPEWNEILLWITGGIIIIGKIIFIYKGFRIFFQQLRSWLVFLCYLCSLEIVPLILAYLLACQICVKWL